MKVMVFHLLVQESMPICQSLIQLLIKWAGWQTKDETNEPATSVASYGASFNKFWFSMSPEEIYGIKSSVSLKKDIVKEHCPLPALLFRLLCSDTDGESTALEPPCPDTIMVDPQVLWLPPNQIGQDIDDQEQLFKIVVNALASGGINGYEFYQYLKKD
ncbi:hypothetical protein BT96DRAFT_947966 [Gymnopus androsaceus JB14]|uniref:Uncharacterized protein n=1 Tax=Gymnopus androsaceus JB14 TaxID=1447944 RepID=A0A6A4GRG1_9AGAR|nr:hypothetical protein BT96DRAFT_947966 [Gymnopus androsaceus JB14]